MQEELTSLESAWSIWLGETGIDMDEAFADFSTPQQWCDAGIFPGDHELFIVQGYSPQDVQHYGVQGMPSIEALRQQSFCPRLRLWVAHLLISTLCRFLPSSSGFRWIFNSGKYILSRGG